MSDESYGSLDGRDDDETEVKQFFKGCMVGLLLGLIIWCAVFILVLWSVG